MAISTTAKSKVYIGTTVAATTLLQYEADTFTEVKQIEDIGEFGDEAEEIKVLTVEDSRVRKLKGARDAGTVELTVGRDALDAGQDALRAASLTDFAYNVKVILNDAPSSTGTPTKFYFRAMVASARNKLGGANDVTKQTFALAVTSEILEVSAAA